VIPFKFQLASDWTFFGLTPEYSVSKHKQLFDLVYHSKGGFTYSDVLDMPIHLRVFYIKKLEETFKNQRKEHEKAMKQSRTKAPRVSKPRMPRIRRR
jgi:hypothetical protein